MQIKQSIALIFAALLPGTGFASTSENTAPICQIVSWRSDVLGYMPRTVAALYKGSEKTSWDYNKSNLLLDERAFLDHLEALRQSGECSSELPTCGVRYQARPNTHFRDYVLYSGEVRIAPIYENQSFDQAIALMNYRIAIGRCKWGQVYLGD